MGNMPKDPPPPAPHVAVAQGFSKPPEPSQRPRYSDEGIQERRGLWTRLKVWFARPAAKRDSYVSNLTNPDDRRFIPRS